MQPSQFNPVKSAGQGLIAAAQNQFTNPTVTPEMSYTTQTNNLMSGGNPLIEQAKRRAAQEANRRGMIGGSIHAANAADASLQAAAAVAGKDVDAQNQFALNNLSARNQAYLKSYDDQLAEPWRNQAAQENARQFDVSQGNDLKKQEIQLGFTGNQAALDRAEREKQFNTTAGLDQQRIDAANKTFGQNTFTNYTNQMNAILNNPNLTPAAKKEAQATLNALYTGRFDDPSKPRATDHNFYAKPFGA